ncbi:SRPBCC family protein [Actinophytocola gossypii]|uniref:SRPBCC domain-containing protein n=1 Tax=Actinophytocola gossypii TaxID=2812003 RepID=A0ABT2JGF7_9PSEU|nr:SRPBCC domain-containing protein [Actinophytocola gossypii]MCT2586950.1 SRPBCC domain-containing protein [Actinophytocola gossypii]
MNDTPRIEVTVAAPVDTVWRALRDKDTIRHWHGWDYDGLDDEIDLIYFTEVDEDPAARTLSVQAGDVIRLEPDGDGTRVTLTRAPRGVNPDWDAYYGEITEGWITFLHQLRFAVERGPGAARRTVFLTGANPSGRSLAQDLGLPLSGPVATDLLGEHVTGEHWYRSANQLGIAVDAWGGGLLVLSSHGPVDGKPNGVAMALLSTYGLDDARFAELRDRWTAWWDEHVDSGE